YSVKIVNYFNQTIQRSGVSGEAHFVIIIVLALLICTKNGGAKIQTRNIIIRDSTPTAFNVRSLESSSRSNNSGAINALKNFVVEFFKFLHILNEHTIRSNSRQQKQFNRRGGWPQDNHQSIYYYNPRPPQRNWNYYD
ncbi:unnamed protein product, partial [Allacma fusca]